MFGVDTNSVRIVFSKFISNCELKFISEQEVAPYSYLCYTIYFFRLVYSTHGACLTRPKLSHFASEIETLSYLKNPIPAVTLSTTIICVNAFSALFFLRRRSAAFIPKWPVGLGDSLLPWISNILFRFYFHSCCKDVSSPPSLRWAEPVVVCSFCIHFVCCRG